MGNNNKGTLFILFVLSTFLGGMVLMVSGCGDTYGTPYSYQSITPNDGSVAIKLVNNTSLEGGLHAPSRQTSTYTTSSAGTLIKIFPDDIWLSVSELSIFTNDGKEYVLFTEPKEINLQNLLKDGELIGQSTDVPVGHYNRLKFSINYVRVYHEGRVSRIAMDQTVYISTNDSNLTTFPVESGMRTTVKLNFDLIDKIFKDRDDNIRLYPSIFGIYEGMSLISRY
jgi:hypothetical protein